VRLEVKVWTQGHRGRRIFLLNLLKTGLITSLVFNGSGLIICFNMIIVKVEGRGRGRMNVTENGK